MPAAKVPARPSGRPPEPRRSWVARPPIAPMAAPAEHARQVQRDVAAAARHRVQEHHGRGADCEDRDGQGPQVELVLADLADDEEDEQRVDQVNIHAASVPRGPVPGRQPPGGTTG